ncbi:hypothetical protein [Reinekea sp.]|uniref:hypothetical protein n=1 Tax=Reinekea sp. TaxID=1970455 RepID=UPI00257F2EFA|nr:hypothetical protein [Reinekea sp.]
MAMLLAYFRTLMLIARQIQVDLFRIAHYAAISIPFVNIVVASMLVLSCVMIVGFTLPAEGFSKEAATVSMVFGLTMSCMMLLLFMPIWVLRQRIRDVKQAQLDIIANALAGDTQANSQVLNALPGQLLSTEELMVRQLYVNAQWDWPIAAHIQKLIAFCLLPPLTWVLAAAVENFLF